MAKHAIRASVKPGMGPSRQILSLEKYSVFVGEENNRHPIQKRQSSKWWGETLPGNITRVGRHKKGA